MHIKGRYLPILEGSIHRILNLDMIAKRWNLQSFVSERSVLRCATALGGRILSKAKPGVRELAAYISVFMPKGTYFAAQKLRKRLY